MSTSATLMATRGYCRKSQLISNENPPCSAPTLTLLANDTWSATRQGEDKPRPYYATMKRLKRPAHRRGDPGGRPVNCPRPACLLALPHCSFLHSPTESALGPRLTTVLHRFRRKIRLSGHQRVRWPGELQPAHPAVVCASRCDCSSLWRNIPGQLNSP